MDRLAQVVICAGTQGADLGINVRSSAEQDDRRVGAGWLRLADARQELQA